MASVEIIKINANSDVKRVAGSIAQMTREGLNVEIQVIGAGCVNKAVKAVAIARGYLSTSGYNLAVIPAFTDIEIDGEKRTAIKLIPVNLR